MPDIGGNQKALLQVKADGQKNQIGERAVAWSDAAELIGWLDLAGGDSRYTNYSAKIQESTHIFLCDFVALNLASENTRMLIDGRVYDVLLIDDPMGMHQQLEIYLKFVGGQGG